MDLTKTVKLQIKLSNDKDAALLKSAMEHYRLACDDVSDYVFDHDFLLNTVKLQIALYAGLREQFNLKAQMAISVLRTVTARYKAVRTQLKQKPYRYQDDAGKWQKQAKDLTWLWRPVSFHRPQLDLVRGRDWSIRKDGSFSLNTLDKRITVWPVMAHWSDYLTAPGNLARLRC